MNFLALIPALATVAALLTLLSAALGRRLQLLDRPDARKRHSGSIPLTGGIAIYLTVLLGSLLFGITIYELPVLLIASTLFVIGVFDDFRHLNPWLRLAIQYLAGLLLAASSGIVISNVGNLLGLGAIPLLWLAIPLTALSVAGLCNAYNMIDGIDGLAASLLALPLAWLLGLALLANHPAAPLLLLLLVPLAVFLLFNLGPDKRWWPKVFLGDAGSITLGFLVTVSLIYFSQGENALIRPVTALWLVTVPLMDMLATMGRRLKQRRPLMRADRNHLHHALLDRGLGARACLRVLVTYAALTGWAGIALEQVPEYISMALYFLLFFGHCGFLISSDRHRAKSNKACMMENAS